MDELLLDTTYLLPVLGVGIELKAFEGTFSRLLRDYTVLYNPISMIECKWIVLRSSRRERGDRSRFLERYRVGVGAILRDERLKQTAVTDEMVERAADRLLIENHVRDYFDRTIYGTACARNSLLLTEDKELRDLGLADRGTRPRGILSWADVQ
jgi:PIN domain nuclease of toxin-antitoxin system